MKAKVYEMFKSTNPRIRAHERNKAGQVIIVATCSDEHEKKLEELIENSEEEVIKIISKTDETIYFTVTCEDYEFTDKIIQDFF